MDEIREQQYHMKSIGTVAERSQAKLFLGDRGTGTVGPHVSGELAHTSHVCEWRRERSPGKDDARNELGSSYGVKLRHQTDPQQPCHIGRL